MEREVSRVISTGSEADHMYSFDRPDTVRGKSCKTIKIY